MKINAHFKNFKYWKTQDSEDASGPARPSTAPGRPRTPQDAPRTPEDACPVLLPPSLHSQARARSSTPASLHR